jgi:hypothetical protein
MLKKRKVLMVDDVGDVEEKKSVDGDVDVDVEEKKSIDVDDV